MDVVLRKIGRSSSPLSGKLVCKPQRGGVLIIEFPDGLHEYVTTPIKRVLELAGENIFYVETSNSRYRLEVFHKQAAKESTG